MSQAIALVLSAITASYATSEAPKASVKLSSVKAPSVKAPTTVESTPSDNSSQTKSMTPGLVLLTAGTISAADFLALASNANVNWSCEENPSRHTTAKEGADRDHMIQAISAYCGWDPAKDFGTQETAARLKAQREIQPRPMLPKPSLTLAGMVAGMPNHRSKAINDLKARERCAVDGMLAFSKVTDLITFRKAVENHCDPELAAMLLKAATDATCKDLAAGCVKDEEGRLIEARKGLSAYFG